MLNRSEVKIVMAPFSEVIDSVSQIEPTADLYVSQTNVENVKFSSFSNQAPNSIVYRDSLLRLEEDLANKTACISIYPKAICEEVFLYFDSCNQTLILSENPRRLFALLLKKFSETSELYGSQKIHPSALIDSKSVLGGDVHIGQGCVLGQCFIGKGAVIRPGAVIGDGVDIGAGSYIGENCVIGCDGFGLVEKTENGWIEMPQIGGVSIGADVKILSRCTIVRGTFDDTLIEDHVRI